MDEQMKTVLVLFVINHLCFYMFTEFFNGTMSEASGNSYGTMVGLAYVFIGFPVQLLIELLLIIGFGYQIFKVRKYQANGALWLAFVVSIALVIN